MKKRFESGNSGNQISFDYSGAELVVEKLVKKRNNISKILNNPGYNKILEHSRKYSSNLLKQKNLLNSLNGKNEGFDFSKVVERKDKYYEMLNYLKKEELKIIEHYGKLCLKYLPDEYQQNAVIYYVIGGYNGIAFDQSVCLNIDYKQFRENINELKLYLAHELFHVGFEHYQKLPDIHKAKKIRDLKEFVLLLTMNEGLATLCPYYKRMEMGEISDRDYQILLDPIELNSKIKQFNEIIYYLDMNLDRDLNDEIIGDVLGQCSTDRLFYVVGCHIGFKIEDKFGNDKIKQMVKRRPEDFFNQYYQLLKD
ncbi:MAG: hypothetical protein APR63_00515 [Desulfuromonas sp. SDB]|nr:MAG: hypothetical protein APR63_00515 [Desulfuromonas sp. SDB]